MKFQTGTQIHDRKKLLKPDRHNYITSGKSKHCATEVRI
jgi:hypothetical protein